jgi:hypothetical protein
MYGYTRKARGEAIRMENQTRVRRIRAQIHLTLSPETLEWLKNNTSNASRLIDTLVNNVMTEIRRDCLVLAQKVTFVDGFVDIRTRE